MVMVMVTVACGSGDDGRTAGSTTAGTPSTAASAVVSVRQSAGCSSAAPPSADGREVLLVDGRRRSYLIDLPDAGTEDPATLVVVLHGLGSDGQRVADESELPERAGRRGAIVVAPDALGSPAIWQPGVPGPDSMFLNRVIAEVESTRCVDLDRVWIAGFSAGAAFAGSYACARRDEIAAIALVSVELPGGCTSPMPIVALHGTADGIVPIAGSLPNMAEWAEVAGCDPESTVTSVNPQVKRRDWSGCAAGAEVVFFRIDGGGHEWPSMPGASTEDVLDFLEDHPLPG
jgi:polyhydroxybutyrate depolymerase